MYFSYMWYDMSYHVYAVFSRRRLGDKAVVARLA